MEAAEKSFYAHLHLHANFAVEKKSFFLRSPKTMRTSGECPSNCEGPLDPALLALLFKENGIIVPQCTVHFKWEFLVRGGLRSRSLILLYMSGKHNSCGA